ncbi:MAG: hypothetical protein U0795_15740 [Pirellulales bacterium]
MSASSSSFDAREFETGGVQWHRIQRKAKTQTRRRPDNGGRTQGNGSQFNGIHRRRRKRMTW